MSMEAGVYRGQNRPSPVAGPRARVGARERGGDEGCGEIGTTTLLVNDTGVEATPGNSTATLTVVVWYNTSIIVYIVERPTLRIQRRIRYSSFNTIANFTFPLVSTQRQLAGSLSHSCVSPVLNSPQRRSDRTCQVLTRECIHPLLFLALLRKISALVDHRARLSTTALTA